jgi:RNA 2',3'-cyclic 3'-phosphodiesterase
MDASVSKRQGPTAVRTFVAVELPDTLKTRLGSLSQRFGSAGGAVRWAAPQLLHITLRFLGDVTDDLLPPVVEAARSAAVKSPPFRVTVGGLGAFPTQSAPRVVWVGLEAGPGLDALGALHAALERELGSRGFPLEERPFSPHITLGRTRQKASGADRAAIGRTLLELQATWSVGSEIDVRQVTVMESIPGRSGPQYIPRERVDLKNA